MGDAKGVTQGAICEYGIVKVGGEIPQSVGTTLVCCVRLTTVNSESKITLTIITQY